MTTQAVAKMNSVCSVIILAGGKSTRMGADKRSLRLGGRTLLGIALDKAKQMSDEVVLVLDAPTDATEAVTRVRVVFDRERDRGPLMGLYSGLLESRNNVALLLPCDMPLVSTELLRDLASRARGYDITVAEHAGRLQPLCAVYSKNVLGAAESRLRGNDGSLLGLVHDAALKVRVVKLEDDSRNALYDQQFLNVNTTQDYCSLGNLRALDSKATAL
jgi:molybdopterin-guanine dinucleotide biosynthesis protein A